MLIANEKHEIKKVLTHLIEDVLIAAHSGDNVHALLTPFIVMRSLSTIIICWLAFLDTFLFKLWLFCNDCCQARMFSSFASDLLIDLHILPSRGIISHLSYFLDPLYCFLALRHTTMFYFTHAYNIFIYIMHLTTAMYVYYLVVQIFTWCLNLRVLLNV